MKIVYPVFVTTGIWSTPNFFIVFRTFSHAIFAVTMCSLPISIFDTFISHHPKNQTEISNILYYASLSLLKQIKITEMDILPSEVVTLVRWEYFT